jgi:dolichol kinase
VNVVGIAFTFTEKMRKVVHLSALLVPVVSELTSKSVIAASLISVTIIYSLEEVLRLKGHRLPIITPFTLKMSRPEERTSFIMRPAYLAIGIILALILYPSKIAYASICIGAIGDPVAAMVGRLIGRRHIIRQKTVEGFTAGLVASFLAVSLLVSPFIGLIGATGGMLAELLDVPDDNLTMPVVAGGLMMLATLALHQ